MTHQEITAQVEATMNAVADELDRRGEPFDEADAIVMWRTRHPDLCKAYGEMLIYQELDRLMESEIAAGRIKVVGKEPDGTLLYQAA